MTEAEIKKLYKLLIKFRQVQIQDEYGIDQNYHDLVSRKILDIVEQMVKWYGHDEINADI